MKPCSTALLIAVIACSSSAARADDQRTRYQVLAVDGAASASMIVGFSLDYQHAVSAGVLTGLFGPPLVHALHGEYKDAGLSLAMRAGFPTFGAFTGLLFVSSDCRQDRCLWLGGGTGGAIGYLAAIIVDVAVLSRDETTETPARMISIGGSF